MGIGSYLSRLLKTHLMSFFIGIEILLSLVGGLSIPLLYTIYSLVPEVYIPCMVILILAIGILIGFEIPLLTRILEKYYPLKVNISNVLAFDYLGALVATLLFPFLLLPFVGVFRSGLIFGIINMGLSFLMFWRFSKDLPIAQRKGYPVIATAVALLLIILLAFSQGLIKTWSQNLYDDRILFSKQSRYQKIVFTQYKNDYRLFLNGSLQFSSIDEYRYHESLVHIPMSLAQKKENILVLGGGDGLSIRELLKYPEVRSIVLVDLDQAITQFAKKNPIVKKLNAESLFEEHLTIKHEDALTFLQNNNRHFDLIIADLPDPNNISLARLYSREFFEHAYRSLSANGIFVTQATSPFFARQSFWCIYHTLTQTRFKSVLPYHTYVPSMGDWGFVLATKQNHYAKNVNLAVETRFLQNTMLDSFFLFEKDVASPDPLPKVNTLDHPHLQKYYLNEWRYWR